jgi:ribosomal protein S18 acetylase RimI-like enzyme
VPYRKAEVRLCRNDDEPLLFGLAHIAFGDRPGWSDRRTLDALENDTVFVAEIGGAAAGFVALEREPEAVRIAELLVASPHEDEGVGEQLVEYAEGFAISQRARTLEAVVESGNATAVAFYRRCGFVSKSDTVLERVLPQD